MITESKNSTSEQTGADGLKVFNSVFYMQHLFSSQQKPGATFLSL